MNRFSKILLGVLALGAVCFALAFANGFLGNPVSRQLAKSAATRYLATEYPDFSYVTPEPLYSFKTGMYYMRVVSPSSIDTHFEVAISMRGTVLHDNYDSVTSGWNTAERLDAAYRKMGDVVFGAPDFPFVSEIAFATLVFTEQGRPLIPTEADYAILMSSLELDREYDIKEMAKTTGHLIFYAQDEAVTFDRAAEILLELKTIFDQADVPFYAISFVLEKPRNADKSVSSDDTAIHTAHFPYREIVGEGLPGRLEQAHNELTAYYDSETKA